MLGYPPPPPHPLFTDGAGESQLRSLSSLGNVQACVYTLKHAVVFLLCWFRIFASRVLSLSRMFGLWCVVESRQRDWSTLTRQGLDSNVCSYKLWFVDTYQWEGRLNATWLSVKSTSQEQWCPPDTSEHACLVEMPKNIISVKTKSKMYSSDYDHRNICQK